MQTTSILRVGLPRQSPPGMRTAKVRLRILTVLAFAGAGVPAEAGTPSAPDTQAIQTGRQLFIRCVACHTRSTVARPGIGPHLEGIVGRTVASVPGFNYTATLKVQSFVWTRQKLDQWLRKPQEHFPGMCGPFAGFARKGDR